MWRMHWSPLRTPRLCCPGDSGGGHWLSPTALGAGPTARSPPSVLLQGCRCPVASGPGHMGAFALETLAEVSCCEGRSPGLSPPAHASPHAGGTRHPARALSWSVPPTPWEVQSGAPGPSPPRRPSALAWGPQNGPGPLLLFAGKSSGGEVAGPPARLLVPLDWAAHPPARPSSPPPPPSRPLSAPCPVPFFCIWKQRVVINPEMGVFSMRLAASFFRLVGGGVEGLPGARRWRVWDLEGQTAPHSGSEPRTLNPGGRGEGGGGTGRCRM